MVYVDRQGRVLDRRPIWTPTGFYTWFLSVINFFILFVRSLIDPTITKNGSSTESHRLRGHGGGGGGGSGGRFDGPPDARPRRRIGGLGRTGGPGCAPMAGG